MGLDSVEMVIAVEDRFGIYIPDAQAEKLFTVGDLYHEVLRLRASAVKLKCKTQHVFYRFRASLPHHLRARCRPDELLEECIPEDGRKKCYDELTRSAGVQFPRLLTPEWFPDVENLLVISVLLLACLLYFVGFVLAASLSILFGLLLLYGYLALRYVYATVLPGETVRDFIEAITALNYVDVLPEFEDDDEVLDELKSLIVNKLGVNQSEVIMSARFQQDLGAY